MIKETIDRAIKDRVKSQRFSGETTQRSKSDEITTSPSLS
jgi:hypothetical protein